MTKGIIVLVGTHEITCFCVAAHAKHSVTGIGPPKICFLTNEQFLFSFQDFGCLTRIYPYSAIRFLEGINFNCVTKMNEGFTSSSESATNIYIYRYVYVNIYLYI